MNRLFFCIAYYFLAVCLQAKGALEAFEQKERRRAPPCEESCSRKELMLLQLDAIRHTFETRYTPSSWKKAFHGWNIAEQIQLAKDEIESKEQISLKHFQRLLRRYFKSALDYHVEISFHSTEASNLPFRIKGAQGRYFVVSINEKAPNYKSIPVQVGDEIITFDGKPIDDVVNAFKREEMYSPTPTGHMIAESFLTNRLGSAAHIVPQGTCPITIRSAQDGAIKKFEPKWNYKPEMIAHHSRLSSAPNLFDSSFFDSILNKEMATPLADLVAESEIIHPDLSFDEPAEPSQGVSMKILGGMQSELAAAVEAGGMHDDVDILWRHGGRHFKAYLFKTPHNQRVAFLRLPHYYGAHNEANELSNLIYHLQYSSDALLIDQTNNPGGYFFYMYAVASMLTGKPLKTHAHYQSITQSDVVSALKNIASLEELRNVTDAKKSLGTTIQGFNVDYDLALGLKKHFQNIIDEWGKGKNIIGPSPLMGVELVKPHPKTRYTKPIIFLVNGMSFSCADFLPAMFQDTQSPVVVMGTQTAGAGGFVVKTQLPNRFGINQFSYTASLAVREDHRPIENLGVVPDVIYELTPEDLQNSYRGLMEAVCSVIDKLVPADVKRPALPLPSLGSGQTALQPPKAASAGKPAPSKGAPVKAAPKPPINLDDFQIS